MPLTKILALLASLAVLPAQGNDAVRSFILDERAVAEIPVSRSRVTTINFPSAIEAVSGTGLTTDGKNSALFQFALKPGSYFFSVRALTSNVTANINVVWNRKVYVLLLAESQRPVLSAIFQQPAPVRLLSAPRQTVTPS